MNEASWIDEIELAWDRGSSPAGSSAAFAQLERLCAGVVACDLRSGPVTTAEVDEIASFVDEIDTRAHRLAGPARNVDVLVLGPRSVVVAYGDLWIECDRTSGWFLTTLDVTAPFQVLELDADDVTVDGAAADGVERDDAAALTAAIGAGRWQAETILAASVFAPAIGALRASTGRPYSVRAAAPSTGVSPRT